MTEIARLEHVSEYEKSEPCYSFDTLRVVFDPETNKYHVGEDSGCSCPEPFENFRTLADWGAPLTAREARAKVREGGYEGPSGLDARRRCEGDVEKHAAERGLWK